MHRNKEGLMMEYFLCAVCAFILGLMYGVGLALDSFKSKLKSGYTPELLGEKDYLNWKKGGE